jgi:hypothetical protein
VVTKAPLARTTNDPRRSGPLLASPSIALVPEMADHLTLSLLSRTGVSRVADCPDVCDPAACDVERVHRHGDAVLLSDQAGLAVDRALQDRQARCPASEADLVFDTIGGEVLAPSRTTIRPLVRS